MSRGDVMLTLRVLKRIGEHTITDPITGAALAAEFGTTWRRIASVVEDLRDAGHKIGSLKSDPPGYFLAHHPSELSSTLDHLESQAKKILARRNRMANWGTAQPSIWEGQSSVEVS